MTAPSPRAFPGFRLATVLAPGGTTPPVVWCGRLLAAWLVLRTAAWLLAAVATHPNAPLDVIELVGWGNTWQLGYPQHPPLPAWVAAGFARLSPGGVWGVYLAGYLASACCLWAAWRVGLEYLPPPAALLAALSLDGLKFLTFDANEWNNNVSLNVGWALTVWFGAVAVRTGATRWWAATGVAAGLALLCKYTAVFLLAPLVAYLVLSPHGRRHLRRPGPYLAAGLTVALVFPHVVWVVEHDFITLRYAADRSAGGGWAAHLVNPLVFLVNQAAFVAPVVFILWPLLARRATPALPAPAAAGGDPGFLRAAVLGPVALFLLYGVATGCQLRDSWGATFWTFLGVWAVAEFGGGTNDPAAGRRAFRRWAVVAAAVLGVFVVKQVVGPHLTPNNPSRVHYPGRPLAAEVNRRWAEQFGGLPPIVAGDLWTAGNVCCYSPHRPVLYSNGSVGYPVFDPKVCPWTDDDQLNAGGGVIVWDAARDGDEVPEFLRQRLPRVVGQPPVVLPYQTGAPLPPARVGLAFVPPAR